MTLSGSNRQPRNVDVVTDAMHDEELFSAVVGVARHNSDGSNIVADGDTSDIFASPWVPTTPSSELKFQTLTNASSHSVKELFHVAAGAVDVEELDDESDKGGSAPAFHKHAAAEDVVYANAPDGPDTFVPVGGKMNSRSAALLHCSDSSAFASAVVVHHDDVADDDDARVVRTAPQITDETNQAIGNDRSSSRFSQKSENN